MSDDLVKRLRDVGYCSPEDVAEAADRIEHLENRCANLLIGNRALNIRSDKLEAALEDALQYVSRADWYDLKDETRNALEGKDD
jgi:hypothetical protein